VNDVQNTVLCVDDDDLELSARKKLFEAAGFRVLEAQSKLSALQVFRSEEVDAVVLDYWLSGSGGNGTAVAEEIKRISPTTPVVMLSGYGSLPGEAAIVDAWMSKSQIEPDVLVREVKRLIEQRIQKTNRK
jgi:DNA-binding NtrC family response regulator